jgi:hypothetical protein
MSRPIVCLELSAGQPLHDASGRRLTRPQLAGTLAVGTDFKSLVSISVNDGIKTWQRNFFYYGTNHSEIALGFKPVRTNVITVTVRDEYGNVFTNAQPLTFVTDPLPTNMPTFILLTNNPALMEPGYTLLRVANETTEGGYVTGVDIQAKSRSWSRCAIKTPS